jgi:hypothetical protein
MVAAAAVVVAELVLPCIRYWVANIQWWDSLLHDGNSIRAARWRAVLHQTLVLGWCLGCVWVVRARPSVVASQAGIVGLEALDGADGDRRERLQKKYLQETAGAKSLAGIAAIKTAGVLQVPTEVWGPNGTKTDRGSLAHKCRHRTWLQLAGKGRL